MIYIRRLEKTTPLYAQEDSSEEIGSLVDGPNPGPEVTGEQDNGASGL